MALAGTPETSRIHLTRKSQVCRKSGNPEFRCALGTQYRYVLGFREKTLALEGTKKVVKMYTRLRRRDNRFIQLPQYMLVS